MDRLVNDVVFDKLPDWLQGISKGFSLQHGTEQGAAQADAGAEWTPVQDGTPVQDDTGATTYALAQICWSWQG